MQIQAEMKDPFKFSLSVLNFKEVKVSCEIAKALSGQNPGESAFFRANINHIRFSNRDIIFILRFGSSAKVRFSERDH